MNLKEIKDGFSDALPIIQRFAPSIGAAIGGPIGFATSYIIPVLANAFGHKPTDFKSLVDTILNDPLAPDKLGALEHEHSDILCTMIDSIHNLQSAEIHVKLEWNEMK